MIKKVGKGNNKGYENYTPNGKKQKVIAGLLASLTGVSGMVVAASVFGYDAFFSRYERPDYRIKPGEYCFERIQDRLTRSEFFYKTKSAELKGYYYPSAQNKGLVVVVHGIHAGADDYLPLIEYMVNHGYNVFAYNCTGTYESKGDSTVGMCQSLVDLDETLTYLKGIKAFRDQPTFLIGHSWGGYAVTSALALHDHIRACVGIAPMNDGSKMMVEKAEQYVGDMANMSKPVFAAYQKILFGKYVEYNGVRGINARHIPVLIAQGKTDKVITYDGQSVTAHKTEITNPNVIYYDGYGLQGDHNNIWHSFEAAEYQNEIQKGLKALQKAKGKKLTNEEKAMYYEGVDHRLYSAVNEALLSRIVTMFDSQI